MDLPKLPAIKSVTDAISLQKRFSGNVKFRNLSRFKTVCAIDVSFIDSMTALAVACVFDRSLNLLEKRSEISRVAFPYVTGLLAFREIPSIFCVLRKIKIEPDLFLCDGHGYCHPRRFGIACHLGVVLNKPSIGCAKSRLVGKYKEPANKRGSFEYIFDSDEKIGACIRTKVGSKPIFVSVGHKVTLNDAIKVSLNLTTKFRIPEPLRIADLLTKQLKHLPF
ncbi:MAG: endonuclease V [Planctomycetes bacterium]|nr:endonuclease V [Planctomycetota bacterium]